MDEREENRRDAMRDEAAFPEDPPRLKPPHDHMNPDGTEQAAHSLSVGALAPGLVAECSCGDWSTGKMRVGVDYRPMWRAHLAATFLSSQEPS